MGNDGSPGAPAHLTRVLRFERSPTVSFLRATSVNDATRAPDASLEICEQLDTTRRSG